MQLNIMQNKNKKALGFTLIELLVVVMLIAVLGGIVLGLINSAGIRQKARDAQRVSDIKKIQTALELRFTDARNYPQTGLSGGNWLWQKIDGTTDNLSTSLLAGDYLSTVPVDPVNDAAGGCTSACGCGGSYRYNYISDGAHYILTAIMEISTSTQGQTCGSLRNFTNGPGGFNCGVPGDPGVADCYGVQNP